MFQASCQKLGYNTEQKQTKTLWEFRVQKGSSRLLIVIGSGEERYKVPYNRGLEWNDLGPWDLEDRRKMLKERLGGAKYGRWYWMLNKMQPNHHVNSASMLGDGQVHVCANCSSPEVEEVTVAIHCVGVERGRNNDHERALTLDSLPLTLLLCLFNSLNFRCLADKMIKTDKLSLTSIESLRVATVGVQRAAATVCLPFFWGLCRTWETWGASIRQRDSKGIWFQGLSSLCSWRKENQAKKSTLMNYNLKAELITRGRINSFWIHPSRQTGFAWQSHHVEYDPNYCSDTCFEQ